MSRFRAKFNKFDLTFSAFIKARDKVCQKCGNESRQLECSHIHGRANMSVRCDPDNAKLLCSTCHAFWHSNPTEATEWIKGVMGQDAYDRLRLKASKPAKFSVSDKDFIRKEQIALTKGLNDGSVSIPCFNKLFR